MKQKKRRRLWLAFDRTLSHRPLKQVFILVGVLLVAFAASFTLLSLSGNDWIAYCNEKQINKFTLPLFLLIDNGSFSYFYMSSTTGGWTIFCGCIIYVVGVILFTGMIISVMTNMISHRVAEHKGGLIHYLKSGHYIIMGYDDMVPSFIVHVFQHDPKAYVLVLSSVNSNIITEKLRKTFNKKQMKHIIVNYGHRTSQEAYRDIRLEKAEQVYVVGYHSQPAHDAINVECVDSICQYLNQPKIKQHPSRIVCVFKDLDTYAAFKTSEIFDNVRLLGIEFVPYNFFAGWAKQVFVKRFYRDHADPWQTHSYPAVFGEGIKPDDPRYVHLVFVGTTNFAVAFAMEAANVLHFPNFNRDSSLKTRITFIDLHADEEKDEFITRNRHFFEIQSYRYQDLSNSSKNMDAIIVPPTRFYGEDADFLDVEFEFIKGDVFSQPVQDKLRSWALDKQGQYLSIFLAMADQRSNFVMAMNMPDEIYNQEIPLFVRQDRSSNFVTNLRTADEAKTHTYYRFDEQSQTIVEKNRPNRYAHIYPFGMNDTAYSADEHSLKRAKLINFLYSTYNSQTQHFISLEELKNISAEDIRQMANNKWKGITVALRWSNLYNAYAIRTKLTTLRAMRGRKLDDYKLDNKPLDDTEAQQMALVEHNRWNVEKLLMGYRKPLPDEDSYLHGQQLSQNKKLFIHHDIRPFSQLNHVSELDLEFSRYIPWIMQMTEEETTTKPSEK